MTEASRLSRRALLGVAGVGLTAAGVSASAGVVAGRSSTPAEVVPFDGDHQAGIVTPIQNCLHFAAFDVTTTSRAALVDLLRDWTAAARRMTAGLEAREHGATGGAPSAPPSDTGEALDLPPSALTLTVGFGPSLFDNRFGLASARPPGLIDLPAFPGDDLDPARSGGDIAIQACANDPQVAVHAIRNLARIGFGKVAIRWSQLGFGRTSSTSRAQVTPRNLFGFKDGTNNLKLEDGEALSTHVWASRADGPSWLVGGTYLVVRRIRMHIEIWDRTTLSEQEAIVGRLKGTGAALGQVNEFDPVDLAVRGPDAEPIVGPEAHIRLASHQTLSGARILRRGYNFTDGSDSLGHLDAGLFFIAFNRDTRTQFVPMQRALSTRDKMMEYLEHTTSAHFACPPGTTPTTPWGHTLFT
jgi:deferrochelatase/peroxidase EfeB